MAVAKTVTAQRDFSAGELDATIKRADDNPAFKAGARQMRNWRILNSRGLKNRPGRRALLLEGPRVDEVLMSPGSTFYLAFGNGYLRVYNASGSKVFDSASSGIATPWTTATAAAVIWDVYKFSIYITYGDNAPLNVPLVLTWDGASQSSTWTLARYAEEVQSSGQKRTIFYRLSQFGITLQPTPPVGGSVNSLSIVSPGAFTTVPSVTIGAPGAGGTTATATATLTISSALVNSGGSIVALSSPVGGIINLAVGNGATLQVTGATFSGGAWTITSVAIINGSTLSAGATPSNPVTPSSYVGFSPTVAPTFNLFWTLNGVTLTNSGGSGYTGVPAVTLTPSGGATVTATISGSGSTNATLQFSSGMHLTNAFVGTRVRYCNRQILINGVTSATTATGIIEEPLFGSGVFRASSGANMNLYFAVGQEAIGQASGAKGVVTDISADGIRLTVQFLSANEFDIPENVAGPGGVIGLDLTFGENLSPAPTTVWDEEVMNNFRGWPRSCFVDQGRLGLLDFPALPGLIAWSAVGDFADQYIDANNVAATDAIQELVPGKSRAQHVVPGAEGSEFVFCDNAVYYIPINQTTPLLPGSVAFNTLNADGAALVKPQRAQQSIVYVSAGSQQLKAVQPIGAYSRPYIVDDITDLHSHLLNAPIAIAVPAGSNQFEERYIYVLNADGSLMVGKYNVASGLIDTKNIGWLPWSGNGTAKWVSARLGGQAALICGTYAPNGIAAVSLVEQIDDTQYLDGAMLYNSPPTALAAPNGKGPLWWLPGGSVDLMDTTRMMGTYLIDANGFLVPQNNAGENFTSATLSVGQAWTATLEPFVPAVQPGQDVQQRLRKRRILRHEVYVQNSTGFVMARLFGGPVTRTSPAVGTIMKQRRISTWNQDDDPTQPPPLREQSYSDRPIGRLHDPRVAIIKDTPGPLNILELDLEVTV